LKRRANQAEGLEILAGRMATLGDHHDEAVAWGQVWAVLVKAQRTQSMSWANDLFWRLKLWSWVKSVASSRRTCQTCGAENENEHGRTRYCSDPCRKRAHRCRQAEKPTPLQALARRADDELCDLRREFQQAESWLERRMTLYKSFHTVPPDLLRVPHLPILPCRCGESCAKGIGCEHTGGICLFAMTGSSQE